MTFIALLHFYERIYGERLKIFFYQYKNHNSGQILHTGPLNDLIGS